MIKCLYYRVENGRSVRPGRSERPYCACGTFSQVSQFQEVGRFAWRPLLPVFFFPLAENHLTRRGMVSAIPGKRKNGSDEAPSESEQHMFFSEPFRREPCLNLA